jgi:hypothetical protein
MEGVATPLTPPALNKGIEKFAEAIVVLLFVLPRGFVCACLVDRQKCSEEEHLAK